MGDLIQKNALLFGVSAFLLALLTGVATYLFATPYLFMGASAILGATGSFALGLTLTILASLVAAAVVITAVVAVSLLVTYLVDQVTNKAEPVEHEISLSTRPNTPEQNRKLNADQVCKLLGGRQKDPSIDPAKECNSLLEALDNLKAVEASQAVIALVNKSTVTFSDIKNTYDILPKDCQQTFIKALDYIVPNHEEARNAFLELFMCDKNAAFLNNVASDDGGVSPPINIISKFANC